MSTIPDQTTVELIEQLSNARVQENFDVTKRILETRQFTNDFLADNPGVHAELIKYANLINDKDLLRNLIPNDMYNNAAYDEISRSFVLDAIFEQGDISCLDALAEKGIVLKDIPSIDAGSIATTAAFYNNKDTLLHLIDNDIVDVNIQDFFGKTALHRAAGQGHVELVQALIGRGAKLQFRMDMITLH